MKLKFALIMMVAVFFMTACSDDDNNEGTQNPAQNIAGTYKGYTVAEFKYITIPMTTADEAITITDNADGTANVAFESTQWGKFTISKAAITLTGDNYTIKGSGKTIMGMSPDSQKEYDCTFEGVLSKDKKTASFVYDVPTVMGGLKISFKLGNAPAGMLVAGTYKGYTVAEFKYITIPMTTADEAMTITSNTDGTVNVAFESKQWGKFTISKAAASLSSDNYTIKGSGKTIMGMSPDSQKEYDCTFDGILSKDKNTTSFVFNVPAVMGGLKITFELGNAPANMLIANTYTGSLDLSVNGASAGKIEDSKVVIRSVKDGKVSITLAGFGVGDMKLGDIEIADVPVMDAKDGTYSLENKINTTSGNIPVTGSLNGTIKKGKANITFVMKPGAMPMPITAVFTSK